MFTEQQITQLTAKLDKAHVKERSQAGRKLSYVEGWHAIAEANRIFGFDAWTRETVYCKEVSRYEVEIGQQKRPGWKIGYEAKVRVTVGDVVREGTGHGSASMTDLFDCIESAAKEAETDAMKRALMTFGNPFGLALYDKTQENVEAAPSPSQQFMASFRKQIAEAEDEAALNKIISVNKAHLDALGNDDKTALRRDVAARKQALTPAKEQAA